MVRNCEMLLGDPAETGFADHGLLHLARNIPLVT
jgi:hypothetical protein